MLASHGHVRGNTGGAVRVWIKKERKKEGQEMYTVARTVRIKHCNRNSEGDTDEKGMKKDEIRFAGILLSMIIQPILMHTFSSFYRSTTRTC